MGRGQEDCEGGLFPRYSGLFSVPLLAPCTLGFIDRRRCSFSQHRSCGSAPRCLWYLRRNSSRQRFVVILRNPRSALDIYTAMGSVFQFGFICARGKPTLPLAGHRC